MSLQSRIDPDSISSAWRALCVDKGLKHQDNTQI